MEGEVEMQAVVEKVEQPVMEVHYFPIVRFRSSSGGAAWWQPSMGIGDARDKALVVSSARSSWPPDQYEMVILSALLPVGS